MSAVIYKGYVESISRAHVRGWAFDAGDPTQPAEVKLLLNGVSIAAASANMERPDLAVLKAGRSDLGFVLDVPKGTGLDLTKTEVRLAGSATALPISREVAALEGVIDHFGAAHIGGWAWRAGCPEEKLWLSILIDGQRVARLKADLERPDLIPAGVGDGRHGFMIALAGLPASVRGDPQKIEISFEANGRRLHDARAAAFPEPDRQPGARTLESQNEPPGARPALSPELLEALAGSLPFGDDEGLAS